MLITSGPSQMGHWFPNAGDGFQLFCPTLCFLVSEQSHTINQQELHSINRAAGPSQSALGVGLWGSCGAGGARGAGLAGFGHCGGADSRERLQW